MTVPFVATVRSRPGSLRVAAPGVPTISIRVELLERWDTVRIEVDPTETVLAVKVAALAALAPHSEPDEYMTKLRGFEVLDELLSVRDAGAVDGSIFLLAHRRRRAVR